MYIAHTFTMIIILGERIFCAIVRIDKNLCFLNASSQCSHQLTQLSDLLRRIWWWDGIEEQLNKLRAGKHSRKQVKHANNNCSNWDWNTRHSVILLYCSSTRRYSELDRPSAHTALSDQVWFVCKHKQGHLAFTGCAVQEASPLAIISAVKLCEQTRGGEELLKCHSKMTYCHCASWLELAQTAILVHHSLL